VADITNKLFNLKNCVQKEHDALREQVRGLEQANRDLMDKLNNG
jgi:site-specific DNA-adenine methylase